MSAHSGTEAHYRYGDAEIGVLALLSCKERGVETSMLSCTS